MHAHVCMHGCIYIRTHARVCIVYVYVICIVLYCMLWLRKLFGSISLVLSRGSMRGSIQCLRHLYRLSFPSLGSAAKSLSTEKATENIAIRQMAYETYEKFIQIMRSILSIPCSDIVKHPRPICQTLFHHGLLHLYHPIFPQFVIHNRSHLSI